MVKNLPANSGNTRDAGSIPELGRFSGRRNGNTLQYSCLRISWTEEPGGLQSAGSQRVEHALKIAVKRREVKSKRAKERYKHLNAEFQRIARRDKKAFLSDQCKEIEENNRMGKTRDLFKKIRDTKGTFHAKMGSIKDRNCMDLTEAEGIKKRWQEYTEELYKKDLQDPDNHDAVITHLEPDILELK